MLYCKKLIGGIIIYYPDHSPCMEKPQPNMAMMTDMPKGCYSDHNEPILAMAYVIMQPQITNVYHPEDALKQGTLFPELDKPFLAYKGAK